MSLLIIRVELMPRTEQIDSLCLTGLISRIQEAVEKATNFAIPGANVRVLFPADNLTEDLGDELIVSMQGTISVPHQQTLRQTVYNTLFEFAKVNLPQCRQIVMIRPVILEQGQIYIMSTPTQGTITFKFNDTIYEVDCRVQEQADPVVQLPDGNYVRYFTTTLVHRVSHCRAIPGVEPDFYATVLKGATH